MSRVAFIGVTKRFGNVTAVADLDLEIADREFLVLLGPSGCGKSTALRMLAGLDEPDAGTIMIGDAVVNDVEPKNRDVAMVFQSYALYPHMTVERNIAFPLKARRVPMAERQQLVAEAAARLGLSDLLQRKPAQLSGGQRQRVALARAIVRRPTAFLMDEPLSNLDAKLRVQTRAELIELHQTLATTIVYVTHDQVEAMTMGQRIAILDQGVLQQVGAPQAVYERPANSFVARFIGSPPMNTMTGEVEGDGGAPTAVVAGARVALDAGWGGALERGPVTVGIRPEHVAIDPQGPVGATVTVVEALGHELHVNAALEDETPVVVRVAYGNPVPGPGEVVRLRFPAEHVHLFSAGDGTRIPRPGER